MKFDVKIEHMTRAWRAWWKEFRRWRREPRVLWRSENATRQVTIEVQHWVPFVVFLIVLFWYIIDPAPVALMSAVMLGGMIVASFLWARSMGRGVVGQRRLRFAAMQVGDELEEQIYLWNASMLPVL
jgi:hypothetical protein